MTPASTMALQVAAEVVAEAHGYAADAVLAPERVPAGSVPTRRELRGKRHLAAYLANVGLGVPLAHVASAVGIDRAAIRRGFHRIEDGREDGRADRHLTRLERRAQQRFRQVMGAVA